MLEIQNISIEINNKYLVKNLSLTLKPGDKLAIIGEEGNGKSTLLKSILGICKYAQVSGNIRLHGNKIGYLEQFINEKNGNETVYDFLFESKKDNYEKVNLFYKYRNSFHLDDKILDQNISTLSGGEKVKVGILKLLINKYDILFLDEPTNDLDLETLEWLENFINHTNKPILYVSHDETLLSNTANGILHLEQIKKKTECRHMLLKIDYDSYISSRIDKIEKETQIAKFEKRKFNKQQEKLRTIMQKVEQQQNNISRQDPHGAKMLKKKMHSLKSQEKKLNNSERTEIPDVEESIYFFFETKEIPSKKRIASVHLTKLNVEGKTIAKNIDLDIIGNTHLCIIGKNGVGKSTLIKLIQEQLNTRTDLNVGYMPQNYEEILNQYEYVLDFITDRLLNSDITKIRFLLGNMKFTKEEMISKIKDLSSGTKAKLFFVKFAIENCNVLILDEPTRNMSPLSNPVIRKALKEFKGTIISVSHDRKYINEVAEQIYELTLNGLKKISFHNFEKE